MLSSKISRSVHRTWNSPPVTAASSTCLTAMKSRSSHQRRRSSSKASCPPDSNDKPTPTAKAVTNAGAEPALRSKRTTKFRRSTQDKAVKVKDGSSSPYMALPAVPDLQHLHKKDYAISSFFSMHRPLSVTTPLPQPVPQETFSSLFEPSGEDQTWNEPETRFDDVVRALSQSIESIENATTNGNDSIHVDVLQESASNSDIRHLDTRPRMMSVEDIVAQARPYQLPPPPMPQAEVTAEKKVAREKKRRVQPRQEKRYTIELTLTETMVPVDEPASTFTEVGSNNEWTPYRRRRDNMMDRQPRRSNIKTPSPVARIRQAPSTAPRTMHMISVKRQRKLKMKKHKYKKLMKRTRNLRRRLENR